MLDYMEDRLPGDEWVEELRAEITHMLMVQTRLIQQRNNRTATIKDLEKHSQRLIDRNAKIDELLKTAKKERMEEERQRLAAEKTIHQLRQVNHEQAKRIALMYEETSKVIQMVEMYKVMFRALRDGLNRWVEESEDELTLQQKSELSQLTSGSPFDLRSHRPKQ